MTRIKFCGFTRAEDVEFACELGVNAVGFVLESGSPRRVDTVTVQRLAMATAPFVKTVSVFGRFPGLRSVVTDLVQAVEFGSEPPVPFILAKRLGGPPDQQSVDMSKCCGLLMDAYSPEAFGGTGTVADWSLAADLVEKVNSKWILAGGLTPDNVVEAIRVVRPYAVDVSSGIESSPGIKDHGKMRAFAEAVWAAG